MSFTILPPWSESNPPKVGDWFISKASYCGGENPKCTSENPCPECLDMCNQFIISGQHCGIDFFYGGHWCNRKGGCTLNETDCYVLTFRTERYRGVEMRPVSDVTPIRIEP